MVSRFQVLFVGTFMALWGGAGSSLSEEMGGSLDVAVSNSEAARDPYVCNVGLTHQGSGHTSGNYLKLSFGDGQTQILTNSSLLPPNLWTQNFAGKPITSIRLGLGSESSGAQFFLDICYPEQMVFDSSGHVELQTIVANTFLAPNLPTSATIPLNLTIQGICFVPADPNSGPLILTKESYAQIQNRQIRYVWAPRFDQRCVVRYTFSEQKDLERALFTQKHHFQLQTMLPDLGCVKPNLYWLNFSGKVILHQFDPTWNMLPLGPNSFFLNTAYTWYDVLVSNSGNMHMRSYMILAQGYIGATLNYFAKANLSVIATDYQRAQQLLESFSPDSVIAPEIRSEMVALGEKLSAFNAGALTPSLCE